VVVAAIEGEIDLSNASAVSESIIHALPNDSLGVVVDLSEVRYIDSAGIGMFFEAIRRLAERRQTLALALPDESPVRRLLKITNLDGAATVRSTVDESVTALRLSSGETG
jgi:anti-sigma B factor antagonist